MDKTNRVNGQIRKIRSFVRRAGRTTNAQSRAMNELAPQFLIPFTHAALDWSVFEHTPDQDSCSQKILEIGFGMGETTEQIALARPQDNFLGVEVFNAGVGALLKRIETSALENIRIIQHDAVEVLEDTIADNSLDTVQLFFPDPWHKKRHHKRRIVQPEFVQLLRRKLKPGGVFHMATDWENYAEHMLEVMKVAEGYSNLSETNDYVPRPEHRPLTKFENRGVNLGHGVWDLMFRKES